MVCSIDVTIVEIVEQPTGRVIMMTLLGDDADIVGDDDDNELTTDDNVNPPRTKPAVLLLRLLIAYRFYE